MITGLHRTIELSFLIAGHTKFSPDGCFGVLKRQFRRTKVNTLQDIVEVVNKSASLNHAELTGTQSGETLIPVYDWSSFFQPHLHKLAGIKTLHHIAIHASSDASRPADIRVCVRQYADSPPTTVSLVRDSSWCPAGSELPSIIEPNGLDAARKWYLYDQIRDYCSEETKDLVCPLPQVPRPGNPHSREQPSTPAPQRHCRKCNQPGHNARTCPLR